MPAQNSMDVPEDVPFDERLFESNSLLKQYWEVSVGGRAELAQMSTQRSAVEDDLRQESLKLYDSLLAKAELDTVAQAEDRADREDLALRGPVAAPAPAAPVVRPAIPARAGPIVQPKSISTGGWIAIWVVAGLAILFFCLQFFRDTLQQWWAGRALINTVDGAAAVVAAPINGTLNAVAAVADSTGTVVNNATNGITNSFSSVAMLPMNPMMTYQPSNSLFSM